MSANPLFRHMCTALDVIFPADPAPIAYALPEDSTLALPERTSITLINGEILTFDLYQLGPNDWSAKNADQDHQCGWGATAEDAIAALEHMCNDDIGPCACCGTDPCQCRPGAKP